MTILDNTGESELVQLLNTIQELSEQLAHNRSLAITLHASTGAVKTQAAHSQSGFVLRRFNLDKTQDVYDAELERMNAALAAENQGLLHDNKQLGTLIKEYEQTLEGVMAAFRTKARDVQEHELALIREYEGRLLGKESEHLLRALSTTTAASVSLGRLSGTLRALLRDVHGEGETGGEWALERECELARVEGENGVLRRLAGLETERAAAVRACVPRPSAGTGTGAKKMLGGAPGTVGPYGTYKRRA